MNKLLTTTTATAASLVLAGALAPQAHASGGVTVDPSPLQPDQPFTVTVDGCRDDVQVIAIDVYQGHTEANEATLLVSDYLENGETTATFESFGVAMEDTGIAVMVRCDYGNGNVEALDMVNAYPEGSSWLDPQNGGQGDESDQGEGGSDEGNSDEPGQGNDDQGKDGSGSGLPSTGV